MHRAREETGKPGSAFPGSVFPDSVFPVPGIPRFPVTAIAIAFCFVRKIKSFLESNEENNRFINEMKDLLLEQLIHYIDN